MDIELKQIAIYCYTKRYMFVERTVYLAVSLVDQRGQTLKKLTAPPIEMKRAKASWTGRMPFSATGLDFLAFEATLQSKSRGAIPVGGASVRISDLAPARTIDGELSTSDGKPNAYLTFAYEIIRYVPRDPAASSSALLENCRIDDESSEAKTPDRPLLAPGVDGLTESEKDGEIARQPNPEVDRADLARIMVTAAKSLRTVSGDPESALDEDGGLVFDTSVGKIDLTNCQVVENKDLVELKELGSGAFGTVYHGQWRGTDVAIKRINKNCLKGQQDIRILETLKEVGILANLLHPNVVSLYGFVPDELDSSNLAIVTELVADGSLRNILDRPDKHLDHYKRLIIAKGAASGMEYLHLKKIVHFDLKCDNLLVDLKNPTSPICKVADFGLSKVKQDTLVSGGIRGTLPWMAPELLKGDSSKVSEKVDVFSFGIVMWEILTGEVPYVGMHASKIIGGISNKKLRPLVPESCEPRWRKLMEECWDFNPQQRPSFTQIARQLHLMLVDHRVEDDK